MEQETFVNKVANSGLITIDLEKYYPEGEILSFDLKDYLFMGLILKEKDFRIALKEIDWSQYTNKLVCLECTADAIIPVWAYMLVVANLEPFAAKIVFGNAEQAIEKLIIEALQKIEPDKFIDQRVVIKGCGEKHISEAVYVEITRLLRPVVKSIMYGEPCSTVPVYKKATP